MNKYHNIIISLTSIYQRQSRLINTLKSIFNQNLHNKYKISEIILNLSVEPYLLDTGFINQEIDNLDLLKLINEHLDIIKINWVPNTGPYRKLLPTLDKYWTTPEQIIITIDDDIILERDFVYNLVKEYEETNEKYCVAYRGYTMDWQSFQKDIKNIKYYIPRNSPIPLQNKSLYNFSTNGAGTLWTPGMFQKHLQTKELLFNFDIIQKICPSADDIWYNFMRIMNGIELYIPPVSSRIKLYNIKTDRTTALYYKINNMSVKDEKTNEELDKNTYQLRSVYQYLNIE